MSARKRKPLKDDYVKIIEAKLYRPMVEKNMSC